MSALDSPWRGTVSSVHAVGRCPHDEHDMAIVYITLDDQNVNVGHQRQGQLGVAMPVADAPAPHTKVAVHIVIDDLPVVGEAQP